MNLKTWAEENLIHKIVAGSHLYGTATPNSDVDIRGVCLMPKEALLGLTRFDQYQSQNGEDVVIYGLSKFIKLSLDANPNILDILFAAPERWQVKTRQWWYIYDNRHLFLSQKLRHTFSGYAISQLKRIKGHRRWLTNPPDYKPELSEFRGEIEKGTEGEQKLIFPNQHFETQYQAAMKQWKDYQRWLENRNPARAELERKYGYDTKHAGHLVRLMTQAESILIDCDYNPTLKDENLEIVRQVMDGDWEYDYLISWAERIDETIRGMPTELPKKPQFNAVQDLLMDLNWKSLERG